MTKDEIMRLAAQVWSANGLYIGPSIAHLSEFAALVAAKEREACAVLCESRHENGNYKYDHRNECAQAIREKGETK